MIDDLISRGTVEPYRMFTSRAEYRLLLREDNADLRLTPTGRRLGLVDDARWRAFEAKQHAVASLRDRLAGEWVRPNSPLAEAVALLLGGAVTREASLLELLRRPEVGIDQVVALMPMAAETVGQSVREQVEIQVKYQGYIDRQQVEIERLQRYEHWRLPDEMDYANVVGLSNEVREKLRAQRPETVGQASRIPGVTPAAVSLLLVHLKKKTA